MKSSYRKASYAALAALNAALLVCVHQDVFAAAPRVAYVAALSSAVLAAFMHAWNAPDAPLMPAALAAAEAAKPNAPGGAS